jgi:hypothetical protein
MRSRHRAAELANKTVWTIDPEVVVSIIGVKQPIVHDALARLNGVTPWDPIEVRLVINVKDRAGKAGVAESQCQFACLWLTVCPNVQLVRQRPGTAYAGLLEELLRRRGCRTMRGCNDSFGSP